MVQRGPTVGQRRRQEAARDGMDRVFTGQKTASALRIRHEAAGGGISVVKLRTKRSQVRVLPGVPTKVRIVRSKTAEDESPAVCVSAY